MKVAISGTHSTGKSTFVEYLKAALNDYKVGLVSDLATSARGHGFPILRDHTFSSTLWMMSRGISLELESTLQNDLVIVDRPIMEPIAYLAAALVSQGRSISAQEIACLYDIARSYAFTYDLLIKTVVDPKLPISFEKERDHDAEFRLLADREIDALYRKLGCQCVELRCDDTATRNNLVEDIRTRLASGHA